MESAEVRFCVLTLCSELCRDHVFAVNLTTASEEFVPQLVSKMFGFVASGKQPSLHPDRQAAFLLSNSDNSGRLPT